MRGRVARATVGLVPATETLRVVLEIHPGHDPARGCVVDAAGGRHPFTGWLAFFSLLDELERRARDEA